MLKKNIILFLLQSLCVIYAFAELRSLDSIFPNLNAETRAAAFEVSGFFNISQKKDGFNIIYNARTGIDPQIAGAVLSRSPGYLVESIYVISGVSGNTSLLDVYNALRNIRGLKGIEYYSDTRGLNTPLFEDATRIVSEKQLTAIPDPPPAAVIPRTETVFIKAKDVNFGNSYYRGEMALVQNGLRYSMCNFKSLNYLFVPIIKEEKFIAQLYFEPIREGVLIYSIAGADISDFLASKLDMGSAISKRLGVIVSWAAEGIRKGR
jgi:hypothetical protein